MISIILSTSYGAALAEPPKSLPFARMSCEDTPFWVDVRYGVPPHVGCEELARSGWCTGYGAYSEHAQLRCPRSCNKCPAGRSDISGIDMPAQCWSDSDCAVGSHCLPNMPGVSYCEPLHQQVEGQCWQDSDCDVGSHCLTSMLGTAYCEPYRQAEETCGVMSEYCAPGFQCDQSDGFGLRQGEGRCRRYCRGFGGSCTWNGGMRQPAPVAGRPFLLRSGDALLAEARNISEASWCNPIDMKPDVNYESASGRWTQDALAEHASVAAFSRFSLQLMAVAAPADLVAASHQGALDEIKHAQLCFGLAQAFGAPVSPGAFVIPSGVVEVSGDIGDLVLSTALEGCVGETVSTVQASYELLNLPSTGVTCKDVGRTLSTIFADEARHAALAWQTLEWAIGPTSPDALKAKEQLEWVIHILKTELQASILSEKFNVPEFCGAPLTPSTKQALRMVTLDKLIVPTLQNLFRTGLLQESSLDSPPEAVRNTYANIVAAFSHKQN